MPFSMVLALLANKTEHFTKIQNLLCELSQQVWCFNPCVKQLQRGANLHSMDCQCFERSNEDETCTCIINPE